MAARLGPDWDLETVEMHHRHKVDAPSGTALALGRAAAARGASFDQVAARGRERITGARPAGAIGFAALRGGDFSKHHVIFAAAGEQLELTHRATNRGIYSKGACAPPCGWSGRSRRAVHEGSAWAVAGCRYSARRAFSAAASVPRRVVELAADRHALGQPRDARRRGQRSVM